VAGDHERQHLIDELGICSAAILTFKMS